VSNKSMICENNTTHKLFILVDMIFILSLDASIKSTLYKFNY